MRTQYLTVNDCRQFGLRKTTLYSLIAANKIEAVKLGSRTLIVADSVERFLASLPKLNAA